MTVTIQKNEAYREIQNLMGKYAFMLTAGRYEDICTLFALKSPDVRSEMNWGIYDGAAGIDRCYSKYHKDVVCGPGTLTVHALSTPVIEIADDVETAKAVWVSPGHITGGMFSQEKVIKAHWAWLRYGCDFIKEDNVWKIWHLHVYGMFMTPFETSWVDLPDAHDMDPFPPEYAPDRPPTGDFGYHLDGIMADEPKLPEPYKTFAETFAY